MKIPRAMCPVSGLGISLRAGGPAALLLCALALGLPEPAQAHNQQIAISAKVVEIKTSQGPARQRVKFESVREVGIGLRHDPRVAPSQLLFRGTGPNAGRSSLITLDPTKWSARGTEPSVRSYTYTDRSGSRGGITRIVFKPQKLVVVGKGENWTWNPSGPQSEVWVHFFLEDESYCARFGGTQRRNQAGHFKAVNAPSPVLCPEQVCGNGEVELGEECDDGNLDETDGCNNDCTKGQCEGVEFSSTFEAIQQTIFDSPVYACTSPLCHTPALLQGGLDLTAGGSHDDLVNVPAQAVPSLDRVEPGDQDLSFLYEKLAAFTLGTPTTGSPMPQGATPISEAELEGIRLWIRGGAPRDLVVEGTAEQFSACLPEANPLTLPIPDAPPPGLGFQIQQTPWPLPTQSEREICMPTYFDVSSLVPPEAEVPCPDVFLNVNNPSGRCFAFKKTVLFQDPQSHHSILHLYTGVFGATEVPEDQPNRQFGPWTYKFKDPSHPLEGQDCDPLDVDPALGYNPGCSGPIRTSIACVGYGPPDFSQGATPLSGGGTAPAVGGSQEPVSATAFPPGVYGVFPFSAVFVWNSHAFNLTNGDTTMSQYQNYELSTDPSDRQFLARGIFDADDIFAQNVPPFGTHEICATYTFPAGADANLYSLSSHTHQWGVRFRIWLPPNTPCSPGEPACVPRGDDPTYFSTQYNDPAQLEIDPAIVFPSSLSEAERTFLFCSLYDNGSTPQSPAVKRQSTSVIPPFAVPLGGPCGDGTVACFNGPKRGQLCNGDDSFCDSSPGAGDGICDACPVRGGLTTTDEMFIMIGGFW